MFAQNMQADESLWLGVTRTKHGASLPPAMVVVFKILAGPPIQGRQRAAVIWREEERRVPLIYSEGQTGASSIETPQM